MNAPKFDVIEWMAAHGHPSYGERIRDAEDYKSEVRGEAGRYGDSCPFTQELLAKADAEIAEIRQAAQDRYDDWASD